MIYLRRKGLVSVSMIFISELHSYSYCWLGDRFPPIVVHPSLGARLQTLFRSEQHPRFTCPQQAELVQTCMTDDHVLAVMPTGSGKSLAFFAAPILFPDHLFIVITPLVALTEDLTRRLASMPIRGGSYNSVKDPLSAQLIIVSAHQAGTTSFLQWAKAFGRHIKRFFIDEAHHIYTSDDYRECFKLFRFITRLCIPITFLSATIAPRSLTKLCKAMDIPPRLVRVIRAPLNRPNIQYRVVKADRDGVIESFMNIFNSIKLSGQDRGIIYCTRLDLIAELHESLQIPYYTSKLRPDIDDASNALEKTRRFQAWRDGADEKSRWMLATLCFGEGIDFPSVRCVIHIEVRNMLRFLQESGRLGRDGGASQSIVLYSTLPPLLDTDRDPHTGVLSMREFLTTNQCRRLAFKEFDPDTHSCAANHANLLCDQCEALSKVCTLLEIINSCIDD